MADTNVVKQIDAPIPIEPTVCQKCIALSRSSRRGFDNGTGNPSNVSFEVVNRIPPKPELCQMLGELLFRLSISLLFECRRSAVVIVIIFHGGLIRV